MQPPLEPPTLGGALLHCRETEPFVLTCVQGSATVRESAPGSVEMIPTTGAMMIAAANAPAQATRITEVLTIAIFKPSPNHVSRNPTARPPSRSAGFPKAVGPTPNQDDGPTVRVP